MCDNFQTTLWVRYRARLYLIDDIIYAAFGIVQENIYSKQLSHGETTRGNP